MGPDHSEQVALSRFSAVSAMAGPERKGGERGGARVARTAVASPQTPRLRVLEATLSDDGALARLDGLRTALVYQEEVEPSGRSVPLGIRHTP
jgi:hypothetical protein